MPHVFSTVDMSDPAIKHIRKLWDITHDPHAALETKLDVVFEWESSQLDLPYGFLSRTDTTTDTQRIEAAYGSHELLQPEQTAPLSESYCRKTIEDPEGVYDLTHASEEGWERDPAYRRFELESYIGARIDYQGETYGTICFAGSEPRSDSFDTAERMIMDMLSSWISRELHASSSDGQIGHESRAMSDIAGVISHDLRNPLSVAQGHVQLLTESLQSSIDQIESAHQRMDDIIDNMLTLAQVDDPVVDPAYQPLCQCAEEAWEMVVTEDAALRLECGGDQVAADPQRLQQLLENLFRNSIEHGLPDGSGQPESAARDDDVASITVEVGTTPSGFYVSDDGPGIPPSKRSDVFYPGYSDGESGTGFGLTIVKRIAAAHDWTVSITDSHMGGARFDFSDVDIEAE